MAGSSRRCEACGGPYFARGLCENCLRRSNAGQPLNRPRVSVATPYTYVKSHDARCAFVRGADGKIEEVIPVQGMDSDYGSLERLALQASDDIGGGTTERDIEIYGK